MRGYLLVAMVLAAGAPAWSQQPQVSPDQAIAWLDRDRDGKCSLQEYLAFQQTRMAQFDSSGDGVLQFVEFRESLQGDGKRNAKRSYDAFNREENVRGLTQREFLGYHAYVFNHYIDSDKDGFMSAAEWSKIVGAG